MVVLFVLGVIAALIVCMIVLERQRKAFEEKFPPISDEEFLARCAPGTRPEIALKVRRTLSEALNVEYERIHPSSRLMEDLGAE